MTNKILLTGATGFVGRQLVDALANDFEFIVQAAVRGDVSGLFSPAIAIHQIDNISSETDWSAAIEGCDTVIHLAARVHVMKENASNPLQAFRQVNVEGTLNLARQAAEQGVKRFIYVSTIKVNGEKTAVNQAFKPDDKPNPQDAYAISKHEAETGLQSLASETGMEVVIIRPPLIYGPAVKGNFHRMMQSLKRGIPLPLGAIKNKRSLLFVGNLVDLIICCINHPNAANQVFLASDDEDISTTELLQKLGQKLGKPSRLIPFPEGFIKAIAALVGKKSIAQRLCGSLEIDISHTKSLLDWTPPVSVDEGLQQTVEQ